MKIDDVKRRMRGLELRARMRLKLKEIHDKGTKVGASTTIIDNTELWYFRESVRQDDFQFFLSIMDNPPSQVNHEAFDEYMKLSSQLWDLDDCNCD